MSFHFFSRFHVALLTGILAVSGVASAQTLPSAAPDSPTPNVNLTTYKLGAGDVLLINVEGQPQYSHGDVIVAPDGKINLPVYGPLLARGLTVAQLQSELRARLSNPKTGRMRNPNLSVSLTRARPPQVLSVYVLGNGVHSPGVIEVNPNYRLTEVLAKVGGLNANAADLMATLTRGKSAPQKLELQKALDAPAGSANIRVLDNDVLTFSTIEAGRIVLDGDIAKPGVYLLRRSPSPGQAELPLQPKLMDAVIAAGGLRSARFETLNNVKPAATTEGDTGATPLLINLVTPLPTRYTGYILRDNKRLPVSLTEDTDYTDATANVPLVPGDWVRLDAVPPLRIYIDGLVRQTGALNLPPDASVMDALGQAGGLTQAPEKVVVTLRREGQIIPIDLERAALNDAQANVRLKTGDIVYVSDPETIQVAFSGEIVRAEPLKLKPETTLLDAVALAGGLKSSPVELRLSVSRTSTDGKISVLSVDPVALFSQNDLSQNLKLQNGDAVTITPIRRNTVFISGQIANTGPQTIRENESLANVITRAGGTTRTAALTRILVERNGVTKTVDAYDAIKAGKKLDFPLQDGDNIVVPPIENTFLVMEAVSNPDFYPLPERGEITVLQGLTQAGSALPNANTKQIILMRPTKAGITQHVFSLADFSKGNWSANTVLQPGDVIFVPHTKASTNLLNYAKKAASGALLFTKFGNKLF